MGTLETSHNQLFIGKKRLGVSTEKHHKCARSISIFTSFFFTDLTALKLVAEDTASFYSSRYIHTYININPSKHTCTHIHTPSITLQTLPCAGILFPLGFLTAQLRAAAFVQLLSLIVPADLIHLQIFSCEPALVSLIVDLLDVFLARLLCACVCVC